jgi:hypothetical protein
VRWDAGAQRALARLFGDVEDLRAGLHRAVAVIGAEAGWDLVAAWLPDPRGRLRASAVWSAPLLEGLGQSSARASHAPADSVLGTALYATTPFWRDAEDFGADGRLRAVAEHGVKTALLIPVRAGVARLGVLECLSADEVVDAGALRPAFEAVGLQLGQLIASARFRRSVAGR